VGLSSKKTTAKAMLYQNQDITITYFALLITSPTHLMFILVI